MEVTVIALESKNKPKEPVIAIQTGSSKSHADLVLNKPFLVPLHGLEDNRIKISLYEQLATQTIPNGDAAESTCTVPVKTADGKSSEVKLLVKRQQVNGTHLNGKGAVGAEDYLDHHQLEARIQGLFELVLKQQPKNPYRCMIEELQKVKRAGAPMAPVPPAGPKSEASPSPAAKGRNVTGGSKRASQEDLDTQAALAQVMSRSAAAGAATESQSLGGLRQAARAEGVAAAKANSESDAALAHAVCKICIRKVGAAMLQK